MKINTILEGNARIHYLLDQLSKGFKHEAPTVIAKVGQDECCVELGGYIYINPFETEESYPFIGGFRKRTAIHYEISIAKIIHGVRYHRDGTGEPDDVDIIPIETSPSPYYAAQKAILLYFENIVEGILTNISEEEMAQEQVDEEERLSKELS